MFTLKHFIASIFLVVNIALYFLYRRYYKFGIIAMLIFGLLDGANFTVTDAVSFLTIAFIYLYFQPFSLLFIILFAAINFKRLRSIAPAARTKEEEKKLEERAIYNREEKILSFMEKFKNASDKELDEKINDQRFLPEAREAATRILIGRNA